MSLRALYATFYLLGLIAEISLFVVLIMRRQFRTFPVFTLWIGFNLLNDIGLVILAVTLSPHVGQSINLALLPLQYLFDLAVLLEISWNVLQPVHSSLPRGSIRAFIVAVVLSVLGGILLAYHFDNAGNKVQDFKLPLDLTVGLLRLLIFAVTAGFAQLLGIGWRNKVLQLTTGLAFYSAADLIISLVEHYSGNSRDLEAMRMIAVAFQLGFFVWVFTTKEVRRREFSPQMEQFLVTLAGRAKLARTALVRMQVK
ncbi:MAG: hypothetical protein WA510_33280 [Acidobacteriaceae bacterium]